MCVRRRPQIKRERRVVAVVSMSIIGAPAGTRLPALCHEQPVRGSRRRGKAGRGVCGCWREIRLTGVHPLIGAILPFSCRGAS